MKWKTILKDSARATSEGNCPNCGSEVSGYMHYLDDYDVIYRCTKAVANKFKGKYADCYPMGDNQNMNEPPKKGE
tara:strand:- start:228 stop:452 length:225 start_codon:yes stop_codon:yes gene_type:complete